MQYNERYYHFHLKYPGFRIYRSWLLKKVFPGFFSILAVIMLMTVFSDFAMAGPMGSQKGPPPMVTVAEVVKRDINPPDEYVGHVEAIQTVDLRARVEGFLEQVNFKEGNNVKAGTLLYVIEQAPYQAKVDAAKALVAQAEAVLTRAGQYLERVRDVRSGGVSKTDLDNAVADELSAKARLEEARANLVTAKINLGYTSIFAPISGRIGKTLYTRGNLVNPASGSLARIVQIDPVRVVYSISENDLIAIQLALHDADNGKKHPMLMQRIKLPGGLILKTAGKVDFVDNVVDKSTGTIAVRAVFKNDEEMLLPGQYVTVLVNRSIPKIMPVVPQSAILINRQGHYVLIVNNKNKVVVRPVTTGPVVGMNRGIKSGLSGGEKVIVEGIQKVRPDMSVRIAPVKPVKR